MRQAKGNIFNGDSYKAIFARAIYKRLMSREWVTFADIMSDCLEKPCENPSKEEHYGELKKAFGKIKQLITEKVGEGWRKRSIPTHSEWLYPLTFDAGKGLKNGALPFNID